eukprot:12431265-Karenia_brevis.AAC.1
MDAALCSDVISSFCTDQSRFIASLPEAGRCNIEQCSLGQCALKPTRLLHVHFQSLEQLINLHTHTCLCNHSHQHRVLIGVDSEGGFNTSPAKQYPPRMCYLIAMAMYVEMCKRIDIGDAPCHVEHAEDVASFYTPLDPYDDSQQLGHFGVDYNHSIHTVA